MKKTCIRFRSKGEPYLTGFFFNCGNKSLTLCYKHRSFINYRRRIGDVNVKTLELLIEENPDEISSEVSITLHDSKKNLSSLLKDLQM